MYVYLVTYASIRSIANDANAVETGIVAVFDSEMAAEKCRVHSEKGDRICHVEILELRSEWH